MGHAELDQVLQFLDGGIERALRSERPDVQLVEHGLGQGLSLPCAVGPVETGVVKAAGAVDAEGLAPRARVRQQRPGAVEDESVVPSRLCSDDIGGIPATGTRVQFGRPHGTALHLSRFADAHRDPARPGGPDLDEHQDLSRKSNATGKQSNTSARRTDPRWWAPVRVSR